MLCAVFTATALIEESGPFVQVKKTLALNQKVLIVVRIPDKRVHLLLTSIHLSS
jgi:hypothetical protein